MGDAPTAGMDEIAGTVLEDVTLQPGQEWGRLVRKGEHVRIIDLEGQQAVDFLCFDSEDPLDRYNAANTMKLASNIFLSKGVGLYSDGAKKLMVLCEDTCGFHDTIGGCCSAEMNILRYAKTTPTNCRDSFERALKPFGLGRDAIAANMNFFMYVPVASDGGMAISESPSKPGDYVELVAERDVICAASICMQIFNPSNGWNPTPIRMVTFRPD
jgi:urea carboxylase-associated protein 1